MEVNMYKKVSTDLNFVDREKQTEKFWEDNDIFRKSMRDREGNEIYMFYDGPPTANGKPHIGHVLTRVIKDMIPRYRTMKGYMVPRKAGWDTHGLPVELEVEKKLGLDGKEQITAERVCGLARVVKANAQVAFDNAALWFERDISHSGAERVVLADSFTALDYMFGKMQWMLDGLQTYPDKMEHNLWRTRGLIFSSKVLLALVQTGITREEAYVIVQRNAMKVWADIQNAVDGPTYRENLEADPEANLSKETLDEIFDPWDFLTRKDAVFERLEKLEF